MGFDKSGKFYSLDSPVTMPNASGFLWNPGMLLQATCRGYVSAQFMQPEPAKYATGPALEAQTFMQPEQPYYAHHPGRFFYIKDNQSGELFSAPYEPVRGEYQDFQFICGVDSISWKIRWKELEITLSLHLDAKEPLECWEISLLNLSLSARTITVYPYFPVGYRSWMNQSADFNSSLNCILCRAITPYQKVEDYFKNKHLREITFLLSDSTPDAWETRQKAFEGEGGLHNPSAIGLQALQNGQANYETPAATMQFNLQLAPSQRSKLRFLFGAAHNLEYIDQIKQQYLSLEPAFDQAKHSYADYIAAGGSCLEIETPDTRLNHFINHWLPRQVYYHGGVNRLTTDPQTRNFLQDTMGLSYLHPHQSRQAFLLALSQQHSSGEMPDGVLLHPEAKLKYINQVPHTDHCVWLPVCLIAYLDETGDYALLEESVGFSDRGSPVSVYQHIELAMLWLLKSTDERGLSYINQGDWCDPMNMVGYQGKGVSAWLTIASAYAFRLWGQICQQHGQTDRADYWQQQCVSFNHKINQYFWCDQWYARGITDAGRTFGTAADTEGQMFLNPQSWSMLSGAADKSKVDSLIRHVEEKLMTPFGPMMLAPSYTGMVEDIGRVTQKFPGTAENGSVYNHAACFYMYALYQHGLSDQAFEVMRKMLPRDDDQQTRGQLPIFVPNYYRGAYYQFPDQAGRSSQLFNTGSAGWYLRAVLEGLVGIKGNKTGFSINPQVPSDWSEMKGTRRFRGSEIRFSVTRSGKSTSRQTWLNNKLLGSDHIELAKEHTLYDIEVILPKEQGRQS